MSSMYSKFYLMLKGVTVTRDQLLRTTGLSPDAPLEALNFSNVAPVREDATPESDLYDLVLTGYNLLTEPEGTIAVAVYGSVPKDLTEVKAIASEVEKNRYNQDAVGLVSDSGVNIDIWTGAAAQSPEDRPPAYNTLLDTMSNIGDSLATTLASIDSATSVDDINNIVNPPFGVINTGRGSGLGPEDLNPSYYTEFSSATLSQADTELYVPGTETVIPYDPELPPPYIFDSMGDCFNPGDYRMQIRIAATGEVIAEVIVPNNPSNEDVPF